MLACSVRPGVSNNGQALLSHPRNPGTQRKESHLPHPQLPLEMGQAELFTLSTDTREKDHKGVCLGARRAAGTSAFGLSITPLRNVDCPFYNRQMAAQGLQASSPTVTA